MSKKITVYGLVDCDGDTDVLFTDEDVAKKEAVDVGYSESNVKSFTLYLCSDKND